MHNMRYFGWAVGLFTLVAVWTPDVAHATRPFIHTESAVALPPGGVRVEMGLGHESWDNGDKVYQMTGELSYSLYANLDLEVEVPFVVVGPIPYGDGIGDIWTKAKVNFVKGRAANPLSLSGLIGIRFPTGDTVTGMKDTDLLLSALASKAFGPVVAHANLFYTFVGNPPGVPLDDALGISVGLEVDTPFDQLAAIGEFIWEEERVPGADERMEAAGGATYRITDGIRADVITRIGFGTGNRPYVGAPDFGLNFGVTFDM